MTITDNGRVEVDEETLGRARELVTGGRMPGKRELQKHLSKGWPVVNEVLTRLGDEAREATERKRSETRRAMRRLTSRKRPGRIRLFLPERQRTVNEIIVSDIPTPISEPESEAIALTAERHPAVEPVAVNAAPVYMYAAPIGPMPSSRASRPARRPKSWPLIVLTLPAMVAIWGGWVDMGRLTGFGVVHPFPGIPGLDDVAVNLAITLPVSLETYAAYALYVWLSAAVPPAARKFARRSAIGSLMLGAAGQVAYHLMVAAGITRAPWWITTIVACIPVAVLGIGAALRHLVHAEEAE